MPYFGKAAVGTRANTPGRRIGSRQLRVLGLQRLQLAHEAVIFGIRDFRIVEHEIAIVGMFDPLAQILDTFGGQGGS
ncbi:hypothetical protein GCM10007898_35390 [Dyella flagellata]|uniref:Uncharacterized protein n=1 Tax=Dyella flagellata TaxID=1867833 RepID=A0ABQ5XFK3_9GAMM|nr:hypothetical protein GCM10007898_35390 [Dyella flagellata]